MRNQFPGTCYRCGKHVAAGEGHFEKIKNGRGGPARWRTQHATCAIEKRGSGINVLRDQEINEDAARAFTAVKP